MKDLAKESLRVAGLVVETVAFFAEVFARLVEALVDGS